MEDKKVNRSGIVFIILGIVFFAIAGLAHHVSFYGIGAAFVAIGASALGKRK